MGGPVPPPAERIVASRYRLGRVVRESSRASLFEATHRNGSTAWLKIPRGPADVDAVAREGRLTNALGTASLVRDDGTTEEGLPYLVLTPLEGETVRELRARRAQRSLATRARAGNALVAAVRALHALGCATGGVDEDSVLVLASGEIALLALELATPVSDAGVADDVARVARIFYDLVADCSAQHPERRGLLDALAAPRSSLDELTRAWRAAAPSIAATICAPAAPPAPPFSVPPAPSSSKLAVNTPMALTLDSEGSMLSYLASSGPPTVRVIEIEPVEPVLDPLSRVPDLPRVVLAVSAAPKPRWSVPRWALAAAASMFLVLAAGGATLYARGGDPGPVAAGGAPAATATTTTAAATIAATIEGAPPAATPVAARPTEPAPSIDVSTLPSADRRTTGILRTSGGPPGLSVVVDGARVGETPLSVRVACGRHQVQLGSRVHPVDVPCDAERVLDVSAKGSWRSRNLR